MCHSMFCLIESLLSHVHCAVDISAAVYFVVRRGEAWPPHSVQRNLVRAGVAQTAIGEVWSGLDVRTIIHSIVCERGNEIKACYVYSALLECLFMQFPVNIQSIHGYRDVCNQSSKVHARLALLLKGLLPTTSLFYT